MPTGIGPMFFDPTGAKHSAHPLPRDSRMAQYIGWTVQRVARPKCYRIGTDQFEPTDELDFELVPPA